MKKKGFTLIELLAVIVILAIIALITVPVVINIINNAKKGAAEDSTYGVIESAKLFWTSNQVGFEDTNSNILFTCNSNGTCTTTLSGTNATTLDISGTKPTGGTIRIENDGITVTNLKFGDYYCSKLKTTDKVNCGTSSSSNNNEQDDNVIFGATLVVPEEGETHKGIVYINPSNVSQSCNSVDFQVGTGTATANGCLRFYIFDDSDNEYKMILDHNTTATVAWNSDEENSNSVMKEVQTALESDTNGWIGNPRLIRANEVARAINSTIWNSNTATQTDHMYFGTRGTTEPSDYQVQQDYHWLFDYTENCTTYGCNFSDGSTKGYWTSTPLVNDEYYAWIVTRKGLLTNYDCTEDTMYGVRPVITLSKSLFQTE